MKKKKRASEGDVELLQVSRRDDRERREDDDDKEHSDMGESASTGTKAMTKEETKALSTSVAAQTADLDASQFAYDPEIRATRAFSKLDDAMDSLSTVLGPSMKKKRTSEGDVELLQVSRRDDRERREDDDDKEHSDMGESASTGTKAMTKEETKALSTSVAAQTA